MKVIGFAGGKRRGQDHAAEAPDPAVHREGLAVSTIKHAHHGFDVDKPGKDCFLHREAGRWRSDSNIRIPFQRALCECRNQQREHGGEP